MQKPAIGLLQSFNVFFSAREDLGQVSLSNLFHKPAASWDPRSADILSPEHWDKFVFGDLLMK